MAHPVLWFEVLGTNGDTLRTFYGSLFKWTFTMEGPKEYGVVSTGDERGIAGGVGQAGEGYRPHGAIFYVGTPSVAASLAEAERLGGTTLTPPMAIGNDMIIGLFTDPEGHTIGLVEHKAA